jgi:flagellin
MVALQTLSDINRQLTETNNRVSTGLKVAEAKDSAAYWAISATTRSDNGALGTVREALSLGKATLDVTYAGMDAVRDNLQQIKELLLSARQPGVDISSVNEEVRGLIQDIQAKAGAATINEQNFLNVNFGDSTTDRSIVASYVRGAGDTINIQTITLTTSEIALLDSSGSNLGIIDSVTDFGGADTYTFLDFNMTQFDHGSTSQVQTLESWINLVDMKLTSVIEAQNVVGVQLARVESQDEFISALIDANDRAIGALVDANMEVESTRLRALQTQQQLSIQSLQIANASANNVLGLFQ